MHTPAKRNRCGFESRSQLQELEHIYMKLQEIKEYFQTNLYEMSSFYSGDTGLTDGTVLWVRTEPKVLKHVRYRIKLVNSQKGSAVFALWGDEAKQLEGDWIVTGKELKKVETLVALTRDQIIGHIDGRISSAGLGKVFDTVKLQVEKI